MCFDKTGTLSEPNLDIMGALPVRDNIFGAIE